VKPTKRISAAVPLALAALAALAPAAHAQGTEPAGGAALGEVVLATAGALAFTAALLVLGIGHRTGRVAALGNLAAFAERRSGFPGWVALPAAIATGALVTAVVGMYWDIALHIDVGRDEGPLANPAHFAILAGLFGIFAAGFVAMVLPKERPSASAVRIGRDWHAPLGGVLICACGAFALIGFPLDDVWHRLFGQDVTLWGPTHLMLIGGASMTLVGIAVLSVEGRRAMAASGRAGDERKLALRLRTIALPGGFLLGLSTFQAEFDFGVPQFRFVFAPLLVMVAAGIGLVAARAWGGRGAALGAVAFFLLVRGLLSLYVGPVLGETTPAMPLYVVEALVVELVALRWSPGRRPLAFGLASGVAIGTAGLAAEWGWSHVWMPLPWPASLLPEAALLGFAGAVGGALIGAWLGDRMAVEPGPRTPALRTGAVIGAAIVAGLVGWSLVKPAEEGVRATVELTEVRAAPERAVHATVRLDPASAADDAAWLTATAWQGDGLVVDRLERVGPGRYRTNEPIPVHGNWKSMIRLHRGRSLIAAPVFMPRDVAIPADEVPAPARFTRTLIADHEILQREARASSPGITAAAYAAVAAIALGLLVLLAWGVHRLAAPPARLTGGQTPRRNLGHVDNSPRGARALASSATR
jgi:hypothetical protein